MDSKADMMRLVNDFAECAKLSQEWLWKDSKIQNMHAEKGVRAFEELVERYGDAGREALAILLNDRDDVVASQAAVYLLRYCNVEALAVLHRIAREGESFNAFCASESINGWQKGEWDLDPDPKK